MKEYIPYEYNGKTMLIERYLNIGVQDCKEYDYDIFDIKLNPLAQEGIGEIEKNGYANFSIHDSLDNEGFSSFKLFENPRGKKIFLYSEVICEQSEEILLCIMPNINSKLWINNEPILVGQNLSCKYITISLNKGINIFVYEKFSPETHAAFFIQLRNYQFEMSLDCKAYYNIKHVVPMNDLILVHEPFYKPTESIFRFMYLKNDKKVKDEFRIDIHDSNTGFVKSINAKIGKIVEIDIDELRLLHPEILRHEQIICNFIDKEDNVIIESLCLYLNDFLEKANEINDNLLSISKKLSSNTCEEVVVQLARSNAALQIKDYAKYYWNVSAGNDMLYKLEIGEYSDNSYKSPGIHEFLIYSRLDDSKCRVVARIPKDYNENIEYPVFISLATTYVSWFDEGQLCQWLPEEELNEPCICFDVTARGATGGSYIGESSTFEIISWIKREYRIDENRIYVLGFSNGGFATYSLAQNHPDIPAAIFPCSGYLNIETIDNISNLPTYQTVSTKDYLLKGRESEVRRKIAKYGNYHEYFFNEMLHVAFWPYIANKYILNQMLTAKRNIYPNQIIFKTCRNRHLKSFWIKLHGIEKGKKYAKFRAIIENKHLIKMIARGVIGMTITIPPQINKNDFSIVINNKNFHFENLKKSQIHFVWDKSWKKAEIAATPDFRKGTGLLDVYMNSLRIIIPNSASDYILKTARNYSEPLSNAEYSKINVKYPIYKLSDVPDHILSHNIIIIDNNIHNSYVKQFASNIPIQYNESGYEYNRIKYCGDYVIMQVISNPYDSRLSILIISTNNERLLAKSFFTRIVVIPFYFNGIHPYWNSEALIFDGRKYYSIYEWGMDIEEVK